MRTIFFVVIMTVCFLSNAQIEVKNLDFNGDGEIQEYESCVSTDNINCWKYCENYSCSLNQESGKNDSILYRLSIVLELSETEMNNVISVWGKDGDLNDMIEFFSTTLLTELPDEKKGASEN